MAVWHRSGAEQQYPCAYTRTNAHTRIKYMGARARTNTRAHLGPHTLVLSTHTTCTLDRLTSHVRYTNVKAGNARHTPLPDATVPIARRAKCRRGRFEPRSNRGVGESIGNRTGRRRLRKSADSRGVRACDKFNRMHALSVEADRRADRQTDGVHAFARSLAHSGTSLDTHSLTRVASRHNGKGGTPSSVATMCQ